MGFVLGFQGQNFFNAMIPSWFKVFCKLCWCSFVRCVVYVSSMGLICIYEYFAHFCFCVFVFAMQLVHGICFLFYGVSILLLFFVFLLSCVLLFVPTHLMFLSLVVFLHQFFYLLCFEIWVSLIRFLGFCLFFGFWFLFVTLGFQFMHVVLSYCLLHWVSYFCRGHWVCLFISVR